MCGRVIYVESYDVSRSIQIHVEPVGTALFEKRCALMEAWRGRLGCERGTLSRLLNARTIVSANTAFALEDTGWGTADHWIGMQASYELAQARRGRAAAERRAGTCHI